jgi:hypothetical protein
MQNGGLGILEDNFTDNQTVKGKVMIAQNTLNLRDVIRIIIIGR